MRFSCVDLYGPNSMLKVFVYNITYNTVILLYRYIYSLLKYRAQHYFILWFDEMGSFVFWLS